jgi:uncharacterized protein (TIGR03437 family)
VRTILFAAVLLSSSTAAWAQVLGTANLTGKYFVRHVQVSTDLNNSPTDERSILGSITFDGKGAYAFTGTQTIGSALPAAFSTTGTYAVKAGGEVTIANPQQSSLTINARYGVDAVIGVSSEATGNTFDFFIAIPAPASTATISNATLSVSYNFVDYELVVTPSLQLSSGAGSLQFDGVGTASVLSGQGHANTVNGGAPVQQSPKGPYSLNADGTGTIALLNSSVPAANLVFGTATRTLNVSASGNIILASTPGGHDILIGLRDAGSDNIVLPGAFTGRYWLSTFSVNAGSPSSTSVDVGSLTVISASNAVVLTQREHQSSVPINFYITSSSTFSTGANAGKLSVGSNVILPGRGGNFAIADAGGSTSNPDNNGYAVGLLVPIPNVTGSGVFLNPQGIVNAASNAPAGDPISPGEFIAMYGTGLAAQTVVTTPPYPMTAGGVSVTIGGLPAPLYLASSGQITCLVPYGVSTSAGTTDIVVTNNGVKSNTVTVPILPTSPGIFSADLTGQGDGIIVHFNTGSLVNAQNPAQPGETLIMYLTGMGALQNPVSDGVAANAADSVQTSTTLQVDGVVASVQYSGINPAYPGLYQINFKMPQVPDHGEVQLLLISSNAATGEISLFAQ